MLYLVRHAKAGSRRRWDDDDSLRPLSTAGVAQAEAIGRKLAKRGVGDLLSSPYVRCMQTLEPLARLTRLAVKPDERLVEGADVRAVLEVIRSAAPGTVLCSHGDVIPETMAALERRGCRFTTAPDWRKGSVWVLDRDDDGAVTTAKVWAPPGD